MNHIEEHLQIAREHYKNNIVIVITLIYINKHGSFPNWSEDQEISITADEIGVISSLPVEVTHVHDNSTTMESWDVEEYHVNVNGDLFFWCNDTLEEIEWINVPTDELVAIYTRIANYWEKAKLSTKK